MIRVQNNSGNVKSYGGKRFEVGEQYEIPSRDLIKFQLDENFIADISSNLVAIGDSVKFFTSRSQRLAHLFGNSQLRTSNTTARQEVAIFEPEGSFFSLPCFNLADKTTWYVDSIRVLYEAPSLESDSTYNLAHDFIVDANHGKITYENNYSVDLNQLALGSIVKSETIKDKYAIVVRVNGSLVIEDQDYTVNYREGKITFTQPPSGPVSCDYSYATTSNFYITAPIGKIVRAGKTEVNLTKNIIMAPIIQEMQLYFPVIGDWLTLEYIEYQNPYNVIDIGNEGKGYIPKLPQTDDDMLIFPFDYVRAIDIKHSDGTRLKISIKDHAEFTTSNGLAGRATFTFYSALEDEL